VRAGGVLNGLKPSLEFEGKSVVMLEQHLDHEITAGRVDRWWSIFRDAGGGSSAGTPMTMIDAGREHTQGDQDFPRLFERMFDEALARPALVDIKAWWRQTAPDAALVQVDIANVSEVELDPWARPVFLVLLFYDERVDVALEGTVRGGTWVWPDDVIGPGERLEMDVEVDDLGRVDWDDPTTKLVAMLEYQTADGGWDSANAAIAQQGEREDDPGVGSVPPQVRLTSPLPGAEYIIGEDVVMEAEASDPDGSLEEVAFYVGVSRIGAVTEPPWRFTWTAAGSGPKSLTAQAKDDTGERTRSEAVEVRVRLTRPPTPTPDPGTVGPWDAVSWIFLPIARWDW